MSIKEQEVRNDGSSQIHIRTLKNYSDKNLTDNLWANILPVWSPDSQKIAFLSEMHGEYNIYALYIINSNGTGLRQLTNASFSLMLARKDLMVFRMARPSLSVMAKSGGN